MGPKADLHGSVLGEYHVHTARHKARIDRPASAIEGKTSANRTGVRQQADHGAREPQACSTPYGCSAIVRTMPNGARVDSAPFVEIQRRGRQEDVDGWHNVVRLGRYRMGAAFGIELQVSLRGGVDSLQAGLNLASRAGGKF